MKYGMYFHMWWQLKFEGRFAFPYDFHDPEGAKPSVIQFLRGASCGNVPPNQVTDFKRRGWFDTRVVRFFILILCRCQLLAKRFMNHLQRFHQILRRGVAGDIRVEACLALL